MVLATIIVRFSELLEAKAKINNPWPINFPNYSLILFSSLIILMLAAEDDLSHFFLYH